MRSSEGRGTVLTLLPHWASAHQGKAVQTGQIWRILALAISTWTDRVAPAPVCQKVIMTADERQEMNRICTAIQQETDHARLTELLEDLDKFLDRTRRRLANSKPAAQD